MALLELQGIVAGYVDGIDILNGVNLGVARGTVTGVIGPNGAGKSTLLKTIFGFLSPRSGRIVLDGREVQGLAPHELKRSGIGYVLQRAYDAFPRLREKRRLRATVLSGGEAKMLSVAKELVTQPTLLLVDEPSAGLAPRIAEQVYERLREVQAAGVTILLVDQNITKAVEVSDHLYLLEMGRVRREGPRQAFADQLREIIRDALLGA